MTLVGYILFYSINPVLPIVINPIKIDLLRFVNIIAVNAIIFILVDLIFEKESKARLDKENNDLKVANIEAKYKLLKDQINPHFLFNALGTAKSLVKREPDLAQSFLVKLSEFLRASISNDKKTTILKDEVKLCEDYIALQKMRLGNSLNFNCAVDTFSEKRVLPYFSLLTLVENAIKHNALTQDAPLNIKIVTENDFISVINNSQKKFVLEDSTKTGLKNLNERYNLLTGNELIIESNEKEFCVKFKMMQE
jgi:two-component system, LytTR family, sensor kinase